MAGERPDWSRAPACAGSGIGRRAVQTERGGRMVAKKRGTTTKVRKPKLKRETLKDLRTDGRKVKGGVRGLAETEKASCSCFGGC